MMKKISMLLAGSSLACVAVLSAQGCGGGGKVCDSIDQNQHVQDADTLRLCAAAYPIVTIGVSATDCSANLDGDCGARYETYLECVRTTPVCSATDGSVQGGTENNCKSESAAFKACVATLGAQGGAGGTGGTGGSK